MLHTSELASCDCCLVSRCMHVHLSIHSFKNRNGNSSFVVFFLPVEFFYASSCSNAEVLVGKVDIFWNILVLMLSPSLLSLGQ